MSPVSLLEFVARLTYNVEGLSAKLRLYFSQFLTFHFSKHLSLSQIQQIENRKASTPLRSNEEIIQAAKDLTEEEKCWAIAAIELLRAEAEKVDNRVVSRKLSSLISDLSPLLGISSSTTLIDRQRASIEEEMRKYEERPIVRIPAAIWPLSLFFVLRCAILGYSATQGFNWSLIGSLEGVGIPGMVILLIIIYRRRNRKANRKLLDKYGGVDLYKVEFNISAAQYTWLAFYLVVSTFIGYLLAGTHGFGSSLHTYYLGTFAVWYLVYLRFFNVGRISENDLVRQLEKKEQRTDSLDSDENDEMIVSLETRLNASTSRLDAYVLESALFGALSFSGFLQIMAADLVSFTALESFASNIFNASQAAINLDGTAFSTGLTALNNKVSLFCLVSVESLLCSIFFLAVIASRLRFSDIADRVRTAINLAHAFNTKEEALYHESETSDIRQSRLHVLTGKVNRQLYEANRALQQVVPVMAYMEYFRNAGILVFLIILISSSLFITGVLAWAFLALVAATLVYFNRESINTTFKAVFLQFRVAFLRRSYLFSIIAVLPFIIAMVLRNSFLATNTPRLMALGYLFVGLFLLFWLSLASHYDEDFGDIVQRESGATRSRRWIVVRNLIAVFSFLFFVSMAFKQMYIAGADELAVISVPAIAILMYFTGFYLSKVKWFGLISGAVLATASVGLLFKILHLAGGREMVLIGMYGLIGCTTVVWWKSKMFHSLLLRFCIVLLFMTFTLVTGVFVLLDLAYAHRTTQLGPIMDVTAAHEGGYFKEEADANKAISAAEWYIATYGTTVPYTALYQDLVRTYNNFGENVLEGNASQTMLQNAVLVVRERDKILEMYKFPRNWINAYDMGLESDLLLKLNRREEAIASLNSQLGKLQYPEQQEYLQAKLAALTTSAPINSTQ